MFDDILNEVNETILNSQLRTLEKYFSNLPPLAGIEIVALGGNAACFLPDRRVIQINQSVATFHKLCSLLILHELIHAKLLRENGDPDAPEGERFQAEVRRLWEADAYNKLL